MQSFAAFDLFLKKNEKLFPACIVYQDDLPDTGCQESNVKISQDTMELNCFEPLIIEKLTDYHSKSP